MSGLPGYREALHEALTNALENLAFTEIVPTDDSQEAQIDQQAIWARIDVDVPFYATLILAMPYGLVEEFTESIWVDQGQAVQEATRLDFIAEISNTVVGQLVGQSIPLDTTFALSLPSTGRGRPDDFQEPIFWFVTDSGAGFGVGLIGDWPEFEPG